MGTRRRFGVVLDAENFLFLVAQALDGLVIEIDAVHFHFGRQARGVHRETVILRGDFNAAAGQVFDRLIAAAVAKFEFKGFPAKGLAENLVSQTIPKIGVPLCTKSRTVCTA